MPVGLWGAGEWDGASGAESNAFLGLCNAAVGDVIFLELLTSLGSISCWRGNVICLELSLRRTAKAMVDSRRANRWGGKVWKVGNFMSVVSPVALTGFPGVVP